MNATKKQQVLRHLQENGSITSWEAIMKYRATRLSGIIFVLRKMGYPISTTMVNSKDSRYALYTLERTA